MAKIKLTKNQYAIVDDEDFERLNKYNWYANYSVCVSNYYAMRYKCIENGKQRQLKMHREIMDAKKGEVIDHKNHNTLDNRKENLRIATRTQNQANRKKNKNNTSGYKGVFWSKQMKKWHSQITHQNKRIHIGLFDIKEEAAKAYNKSAKEYFGEYAKLNKIS